MDYLLTEEQQAIKELCHQIAEEQIKPVAASYDETGEFPWDIVKILADADIFGVSIPEQYGGLGGGVLDMAIVTEELSWGCGGIALAYGATSLGAFPILLFGNEEQKAKYLPPIAAGKKLAAFAITEADAGSDAAAIRTSATRDGDGYVLNGTKQWITNGGEAEIYTVIAETDKTKGARGASAFVIEKGTPGMSFGKQENKLGIRASATREVIFDDCRIPEENLVGQEGLGFIVAMKTFDQARPGVAAQAVGIAQRALDEATHYARLRKQFGHPISSFQGVQFMLADMAIQVEAARALIYSAARMIDAGVKNVAKESAICKTFASDAAVKVTIDAVQIFGGYGYMKEYPVEKLMRDAKITQIYEGSNEIQRNVIAANLLKESVAKGD
ncbi:MAG: acyl-CoA dehydrogenase [Gemmatimonadales bacterium]|nr:acyl-CoA dehydrogenase [Gemmatimonadales bacterium]NIN12891.1 acyl-CoA dehydrogenase [Gemmatimonadales bacterium]NIR00178.1 acyl-CoA dehydrogenase [Gemmatimonadales bacterium]NIS65971.1 acyl-CoA dehydrogenase [Gemmatimonadales bacterium]